MSADIGRERVTKNIKDLLDCIREFDGCKILITSRAHFFDIGGMLSGSWRGQDTTIYVIAPIARSDVVRHVAQSCIGSDNRQLLQRLQ